MPRSRKSPHKITTKRVYEPASPGDGERFFVERLWPRGLKKERLQAAGWLQEVSPSPELRRWFGHDPARWAEFERRYFAELDRKPASVEPLLAAARGEDVTLLFAARDLERNSAVALREYLEARR